MRNWINLFEKEGTPLFFVPIRYWENDQPETGHLVKDEGGDSLYVYHDGYGHNVYMPRDRSFTTREAAVAEAHRLAAEKQAKDDGEFEEMMARMDGTHVDPPKPPKDPKVAHFVPDVGTIVEYGMDSFGKKPATYRVSAWLKEATPPPPSKYDFLNHLLYSTQQKVGPDEKRLEFCTREQAEYLSLSGIAGAIARVGDVKVVGRVNWSEEMLADERAQALALVGHRID